MKRKLRLRNLSNEDLFGLYNAELQCRHRSPKGLYEDRRILGHFQQFLGLMPPSPELGKQFLSQYGRRKPATLARYLLTVNQFYCWYDEPLDMKVRVPKRLPPYTEDSDIEKLIEAMGNKATHKKTITRDRLLVRLAMNTGLRRAEIANLEIRDIHLDDALLEVRQGKGGKNGQVPLTREIAAELRDFIKGMSPEAKVFGLKPSSISGKIEHFARKAGVNLHCHQFRHRFATKLIERGANIRAVQQLMRHEDLSATEVYLSVKQRGLREAIDLLEGPGATSNGAELARYVEKQPNERLSSEAFKKLVLYEKELPPQKIFTVECDQHGRLRQSIEEIVAEPS